MAPLATDKTMQLSDIIQLIPGYDPVATAGDCDFHEDVAQLAIDFFPECLTHIEGALAGKPFRLEMWQQAYVANLFGWKRPDGTRRYRESLLYVARKNGKTPLVAGIGCYVLFCDDEVGQQDIAAAGDAEQAGLLYRYAAGMVEADPALSARAEIYGNSGGSIRKSIVIPYTNSFFRVVAADAKARHGGNLHLGIVDELHVQESRDLVDTIETSMASANRRQPLFLAITTADFDRESICNEKYDYACKVRDGVIEDNSYLPAIYELDKEDDWADPKIWPKANPNLGVSVSMDYMERKCKKAQESPAFENVFKRLHLNMQTQQDVRWLTLDKWDKCGGALDADALKGSLCFAGLDLGATSDLTSFCLLFPGEVYKALWWHWVPIETARLRGRRDKVPYEAWAKQGWMELTPGDETDYRFIRQRINQIGEEYLIEEVAADRLFQGAQLCQDLAEDGFNVVAFGQGWLSMAAPTQEFERLVNRREFLHGGNPVVRWMAGNVSIEIDAAGNMKPSKRKSPEKIDGIVTPIMALGRAMEQKKAKGSIYETQGLDFV